MTNKTKTFIEKINVNILITNLYYFYRLTAKAKFSYFNIPFSHTHVHTHTNTHSPLYHYSPVGLFSVLSLHLSLSFIDSGLSLPVVNMSLLLVHSIGPLACRGASFLLVYLATSLVRSITFSQVFLVSPLVYSVSFSLGFVVILSFSLSHHSLSVSLSR